MSAVATAITCGAWPPPGPVSCWASTRLAAYGQFAALSRYLYAPQVFMLPLASADLDGRLAVFDTVFSMGVLYHHRDAQAHLAELRQVLRVGGELLLETLVIADGGDDVLVPATRYALRGDAQCMGGAGAAHSSALVAGSGVWRGAHGRHHRHY